MTVTRLRPPIRHGGALRRLFARRARGGHARHRRRVLEVGECHPGLGLERLESRALLAGLVLSTSVTRSGDISYTDSESITINSGVELTSTGGKITLDAPSIVIKNHASLKAAGAVELTAENLHDDIPISVWEQVVTFMQLDNPLQATVTIGDDVSIVAGSVTISTKAGDNNPIASVPYVGQAIDKAISFLFDPLLGLPFSVQIKQPQSAIAIGSGTHIVTTGDVTIASQAAANATGQAIWSVLADTLAKKSAALNRQGLGIAAGFSYADAQATAKLQATATISAGGKVAITTDVKSSSEMKSRVTLNLGLQQTNPNNIEVAYAGAMTKATSRVTVENGAIVAAQKTVDIRASATDTTSVKPQTSSYRDGLAGVTVGTGFTEGTVEVIVGGSITAGKVDPPRQVTFNPALTVDFATRSIVFPGDVGFRTGDEVTYATGDGAAVPGLADGTPYFAIVDPAHPTRLKLAASAADALAGRAIDLGAGYPTLTTPKGTLPIVSIAADEADTIWFAFDRWPDGAPLFATGDTVQYRALAGQYVGQTDASGRLIGALPDGAYRVEVVAGSAGDVGMRIRLLDATGGRVRLDTRAQFVTESGVVCQVDSFNADATTVSFVGSSDSAAVPEPQVSLTNGQRIRYVQAFGAAVPGLVDGRGYYAVVDPSTPGVIRLAESEPQAQAGNPAVQNAVPTLETTDADPARRRSIAIGDVQPGTGLVFAADPELPSGTPVTYRAVPGKPVDGLVDGATYYAYPLDNPYFEPNFPQYVVGLRVSPDPTSPLLEYRLRQSLSIGGTNLVINGVDASAGVLSLALPEAAPVVAADSSQLVGGATTVASVPGNSPQVWTNATGGAFRISLPVGDDRTLTAPIAFSASASAVAQAINAVGIPGISVTTAFGRGQYDAPWTLVGDGLDDLLFDWGGLTDGGGVWSRLTLAGLRAVSTTAVGGSFTLAVDVAGTPRSTAPLRFDASTTDVQTALDAIPGLLSGQVTGSGTSIDPWMIGPRVQPLRTGDAVVFHDAWGSPSPGLIDGQTTYVVVAPDSGQGRNGSVVIRLASSREAALRPEPIPVPLSTTLEFAAPVQSVMAGTRQTFTSTNPASGINLQATLESKDSQAARAENGGYPGRTDLLKGSDFVAAGWWQRSSTSKYSERVQERIEQKLLPQFGQGNRTWITASASGSGLVVNNNVQVVVQQSAVLRATGSVKIGSKITERVTSYVDATVSKPAAGPLGVAVAVDYVAVSNRCHSMVQAGASITGGQGVEVDALTTYPMPISWLSPLFAEQAWASFGGVVDAVKETVENALDVLGSNWRNVLFTHFSNATVKKTNALNNLDGKLAVSIAGSVSYVNLANDTLAQIEDGSKINQDTRISSATSQPVIVTAGIDLSQWGFVGNAGKGVEGVTGLGGSVGMLQIANTTRALLGGTETGSDGRPLRTPTGPLLVTAGSDGVKVDATNDVLIIQLAQGATKATNFGFSGMAAAIDANSGKQVTEAAIQGPVDAARKTVVLTAGPVDVGAKDTTYLIPVAGAVVISESKGVGVSTAIAGLDRGVTARVGAKDDELDTNVGLLDVRVGQDLRIAASANGAVTASALAASDVSPAKPAGQQQNLNQPVEDAGNQPGGAFGLAVSGDFTSATVSDDVRASVNSTGTIASTATTSGKVAVSATNTTLIQATAGAAAWLKTEGDGKSASLAGSASIIAAASTVVASVRRATVQGFALDVSAENRRQIGSLAASGSGAAQARSGDGTVNVQVAGSVTLNTITATTEATVDRVTGTGLGGLKASAKTRDTIWSAAGSFLFNFSPAGGGQTPGKSLGVGESFAKNDVTNNTQATVVDSTLTLAAGGVQLSAEDAARLFTFAAGVIVPGAGSSLGGMFSFVTANSTTNAAIDGGSVDVALGGVDIVATSALLMVTGAGDLIIGRGQGSYVAVGAAVSRVGGTIGTTARVGRGASVRVRKGNVSVSSRTRNPDNDPLIDAILANVYTPHRDQNGIWSFAMGVVWSQSTLTADFSVSVNTLTLSRSATLENSAAVKLDDGALAVRATDEAGIYSAAGAIAVGTGASGKVAAGAAVVRNKLTGTTKAMISSSTVSTGGTGTVDVSATGAGLIGTAAVGGDVAGKAALGTALVFNDIVQVVDARMTGTETTRSSVTATGAITVAATERSRIGAGAGQVSVATDGVGAGAAAAVNGITSTVAAVIEQATVTSSQGTIAVKADAAGEIYSYAMGVAGAFGGEIIQFAGVGSGTGNTLTRQVTAAVRSRSTLESKGLSVMATDTSKIDTAAGTLAIQYSKNPDISVAVGISASTNSVGSTTDTAKRSFVEALVSDSTVTTHGSMEVSAKAQLAIQAITAAGAGRLSGSGGPFIGIAGAGAGSGNTIQMDVTSAVRSSTVTQDTSDGISIEADNQTSIYALAGGVAVAGSSPGQSKGIGVEVGAAASLNTVSITSTAAVQGATSISTPGKLTVAANGNGSIKAVSFGVAGALRTGGSTFDLSGAGSAAINTVTTSTVAAIRSADGKNPTIGTSAKPVGSVDVTARDTSSIVAGAGGLSSLFSFGTGSAVGLSVGVSYTINELTGKVSAGIDGASVQTSGDVTVSADYAKGQNDSNISSVTVAGAVGASAGASAGSGVLFPLAGSGSRNTVAMKTSATISGTATVQTGGSVSIAATDASVIYSNAGGVGLGLTFGDQAGAVAVGAAYGKNEITNTVRASIDRATVTAGQGVSVKATAQPAIASVAYGVAVAASVAKEFAASAAGSGASAFNTIHNTIDATILSATVKTTTEDIDLQAVNQPQITTKAGAGALAVAIGVGASLAPGVVVVESALADALTAKIGRADGSSVDSTVTATRGKVGVQSTSAANVTSLGVAVAATAAVGPATGAASGAGARGAVTFNSAITAAIAAGTVEATQVNVSAVDRDTATKNTIGTGALAIGVIGGSIGVSLVETTATNEVVATIGAAKVTATSGGILVEVRGGHTLATEAVATSLTVAIGGSGAGGHAFVTDRSTFEATVATGANLTAPGTLVVQARGSSDDASAPDGSLDAQAHGGVAGLVAVGAALAEATDGTSRQATIGNAVDLSRVASLDLLATASPNVKAHSIAVDIGGVAVNVNISKVTTSGKAVASTGTGVNLPRGDVRVIATGTSRLWASQTGIVGGLLAAGATQTAGASGLATEAKLGAAATTDEGRTGALVVKATSADETTIAATSGSGGLAAGFGTSGELSDTTTTRATLDGGTMYAGTVDLGVDRLNRYDMAVDSGTITLFVGVGITRATVTAGPTANDGIDRVRVGMATETKVIALGEVAVNASHRVYRTGTDPTVTGVGGAIVTGQQAVSETNVEVPATIHLGDRVSITSGTDALTNRGGITLVPTAALEIKDAAALTNIGLLVSGGKMECSLTGAVKPQVVMGNDVRLISHGQLNVGTSAFVSSGTAANASGCALFGGVGASATSKVTVDQRVSIGERATFSSDGSLSITPGNEPSGGWPTFLSLDATARAVDFGVVGIPTARGDATLAHTSSLSFGKGADVTSGGNMYLSGRAVTPKVTATGEAQGNVLFIPIVKKDSQSSCPTTSMVSLAGSFVAGRENKLEIVIPNNKAGGFTNTVSPTPATLYGMPVADTFSYDPAFDPTRYIDTVGYSTDVASALKAGVARGAVGAVRFNSKPIIVSGGSVSIAGDTISVNGATITARTAQVSIRNESPDYLVLGTISIANVEGGRVTFQNSSGGAVVDPQGATVSRDAATPTIRVDAAFPNGVGGSTYGPAIFLAGALENLGGDVTIRNTAGSYGQTGTIAAKKITIETPNGVFAVDTPNDPWNAAGTPAAQLSDAMFWPGGDPSKGQANANQAVMYAINAMDAPTDAKSYPWKNASNDFDINQWVYGNPTEDRVTYVFFGGSTPQWENDTNTDGTSRNWAQGARPDGQPYTWKMTDKAPPHVSNWDHAWVPKLQYLPNTWQTATIPPQTGGTAVKGQVIVVNAKIANINGTLEAGGDKPATQSVVIPASLEPMLLDYQRRYRLGENTAPIYRIPNDRLGATPQTGRLIGASFDARTGQISLDAATSSGAGSVSIQGRIINTGSLAGKIKVRGGSGDLVARNDTTLPLVTGNLVTSRAEKQAVVRITDLNVVDPTEQQTAYVYDGEQVLVYRGAAGIDLPALAKPREHISGSQATFSPEPNARFQWQTEATMERAVDTRTDQNPWPGVQATGWVFKTPDTPWQAAGGAAAGEVVFEANPNALSQRLGAWISSWDQVKAPYQDFGWNTGFSNNHEFDYPASVHLTMTTSIKADWPIAIDFGESRFGQVSVTSVGGVVVAGGMVGSTVAITSSGGDVVATTGGFVTAERLRLRAITGIGTVSSPLAMSAEDVGAVTNTGGIFLDGRRAAATPLTLRSLEAPNGTVSVAATGDLRWLPDPDQPGAVRAAAVSLTSVVGRIGTLSAPMLIDAGGSGTLTLEASAAADIHIRQLTGDMLVRTITSDRGSVQVAAVGNIFNADTWTIDPAAERQRIAALEALGATDPDAYKADVTAFEKNVTSQYFLFWSVTDNGDTLPLWRVRASAALGVPDPTDAQIRDYVASLSTQLATFFSQTIGPDWASLPPFRQFDPNYVYAATPAQVEQFRKDRTVTQARLALQLRAAALDNPPPGEAVEGRVNITAMTVQLASARGSVGMNDPPVTITPADLASGNLTKLQQQELALAANPGDATRTKDGGVVLTVRRPIILAARGRVDVDALAGIAIAQKSGTLLVGHVTSRDGLVSVIADGSILNAPDRIDMWGTPLGFERPADWSRVGNANQNLSADDGLFIPGYPRTASGTWFKQQVSTGSFRASFVYQASAVPKPGDGLAFVLQKAGTAAVGEPGSGLGYRGITGPKAAFLINIYTPPNAPPFDQPPYEPGVLFDGNGTWTGGGFDPLYAWFGGPIPLTGQPVYVTLVYDAVAGTMTATVADRPGPLEYPAKWTTLTYHAIDLGAVLGQSAFMGFTSGTGDAVTSQQVTEFAFASETMLAEEHVTLPDDHSENPWNLKSSNPNAGGFTLSWPVEEHQGVPTMTFPKQPNLAAAAWYPRAVRVSTDFRITFRYRYDVPYGSNPADGMALVFQTSPEGDSALGVPGSGLGYTGIPGKKVGYLINIFAADPSKMPAECGRGTRFDTTGSAGGPYHQFNIFPGAWFDVTLTYDATAKTFKESWQWTPPNDSKPVTVHEWTTTDIDLPDLLGSRTAIFGVTASSGELTAEQVVRALAFTSPAATPHPGARDEWALNGGTQSLANGALAIPATKDTATSSWFGRPVCTDGFTASFTYEAIKDPALPYGGGLAFVLQRSAEGYAAIGRAGSDLGYGGIDGPKVGFLIEISDTPKVRLDLGPGGVGFDSDAVPWLTQGPVEVKLVYSGEKKTLTAVLSGPRGNRFERTWTAVDLEAILGMQAVMGFTTGAGDHAAAQVVSNFAYFERDAIASSKPVTGTVPTVRLWSTYGDIGADGDEIEVRGRLEADAPRGEIHTNPPPSPSVALATVGGRRPNGTPVTRSGSLVVRPASPRHVVRYSTNGGRTWRASFRAVEGLNDVLVMQIDGRGVRSSSTHLRFILDRQRPATLRATVAGLVGTMTRDGKVRVRGVERHAAVEYSVNGGPWSASPAPVEGFNVIRVRQTDLAGNSSIPAVVRFVLKTRATSLLVTLKHPDTSQNGQVTTVGALLIRRREAGAVVQYSLDDGLSWSRRFTAVTGVNRLFVRQIDRLGNVSVPTAFTFTLEQPATAHRRSRFAWRT